MRFLDSRNGGICYSIVPEAVKGPIAVTCKYLLKESVETKAGTFNVNKFNFMMADPFIARLMDPYLKSIVYLVEDSDRSLVIKGGMAGGMLVLEEISNVSQ